MELEGKKVNFLGDSITQGVGVEKAENLYVNRLKEECRFAVVRNYGISGTRIAHQQGEDDTHRAYSLRYQEMDDDADIVIVFGGTNDFGHGTAPLGKFEDETPDTFYGACHRLITGLLEKYPHADIVFVTPLHRGNEDQPSVGNQQPLNTYRKILLELCEYYAIPVLDLYKVSGIQPRCEMISERYCPDGLHPNDAGHALIAKRLAGFLRAL